MEQTYHYVTEQNSKREREIRKQRERERMNGRKEKNRKREVIRRVVCVLVVMMACGFLWSKVRVKRCYWSLFIPFPSRNESTNTKSKREERRKKEVKGI